MPKTYIRADAPLAGAYVIRGNVHPAGAKVTCKSGIKEYVVKVDRDVFTINLDESLPRGKVFRLTAEMPGWIESYLRLEVR